MEGLKSVREGLEGEGELCRWDPEIIQILIRVSLVADSKASARNVGNLGLIPGLGKSPGEGNGNHSSILAWKIPWTEGVWQATVHGVTKSQTRLSDFTFTFHLVGPRDS